jgi:hypothetical protein
MAQETGSFAYSSTGNKTLLLTDPSLTPTWIQFFTGGKFGVNETTNHRTGYGHADANYQWAIAGLNNASGKFSRDYGGTDAFVILDGTSGNPVVRGDVVSFGTGQVNIHLTNANSAYNVYYICGDS